MRVNRSSGFTCLSSLWGSGLLCNLASLTDLRFVVFSVCSAFYLPLVWNDDFHTPYVSDQKLEVHKLLFFIGPFQDKYQK